MANRWRSAGSQLRSGQVSRIDMPLRKVPVEIQEPSPWLAHIAGHRRKERAATDHIPTRPLPLEGLPQPEEGWPLPVQPGRLLDQASGDACLRFAPGGGVFGEQRFEFVPADGMGVDKLVVDQPVTPEDVEPSKRQRGITARERLQIEISGLGGGRTYRVDHDDLARRFGEPMLVGMRGRGGGVGAPHYDARSVTRRAGIKAIDAGAVDIGERDLARHVADRVGTDFGRAQAVKEAEGKEEGEDGNRTG